MRLLISTLVLTLFASAAAAADIHVSPDGTVNELHPDGVYRPVPGAPKQTPTAPAFAPTCANGTCSTGACAAPARPAYLPAPNPAFAPLAAYPTAATCANGTCGSAPTHRFFFRR